MASADRTLENSQKVFFETFMPANFRDELRGYLATIRTKSFEHDKRAYFKSKVLEGWFGVKPEFISYEADRNDLYYAGVLFETKCELNQATRDDALEELKGYVKERANKQTVVSCVVTNFERFETYTPSQVLGFERGSSITPVSAIDLGTKAVEDADDSEYSRRSWTHLWVVLHPRETGMVPVASVIVPRLLSLQRSVVPLIQDIDPGTKFHAWRSYVSKVFGNSAEASKELYLRQSILFYFAAFAIAKYLGITVAREQVLDGSAFVAKGIMNFVEKDNFYDFIPRDHLAIDLIQDELDRYDFSKVPSDFFRILYEETVSPSTRHDLGEFYTPEWLARVLVDELVAADNVCLDPACGSGTFLKLALRKKKELGSSEPSAQVVGFDINPVAVVVARANYLLESGPISVIPVFLADSLMPAWSKGEMEAHSKLENVVTIDFEEVEPGYGKSTFAYDPSLSLDAMNEQIEHMREFVDGKRSMDQHLRPNAELLEKLRRLVSDNKNHVWFYILRNIYTPYYFRKKIDVVIGNPPWLSYRDVKDPERQRLLDRLYVEYNMKGGAQNKTEQDHAGFFMVRAKEFLRGPEGVIGFVLTRSVLNGSQYAGLRSGEWDLLPPNGKEVKLTFTKLWDITERANPFRKLSCMAVLALPSAGNNHLISGFVLDTKRRAKSVGFDSDPGVVLAPTQFELVQSKNFSGISPLGQSRNAQKFLGDNPYRQKFRQGAVFFPKPYFFVDVLAKERFGSTVCTTAIYAADSNKRTRKGDWSPLFSNSIVPNCLIQRVVSGGTLDSFGYSTSSAVLPVVPTPGGWRSIFLTEEKDGRFLHRLRPVEELLLGIEWSEKKAVEQLLENYEAKFNEAEADWERAKGAKFDLEGKQSQKLSLWDNINYMNKLTSQKPTYKAMVVTNKSGTRVRSAVIEEPGILLETTVYYSHFESREEAYYLSGILNSDYFNGLLKDLGLLSERDITKKPFEIVMPWYPSSDPDIANVQRRIAKLAEEVTVAKRAKDLVDNTESIKGSLAELSDTIKRLYEMIASSPSLF